MAKKYSNYLKHLPRFVWNTLLASVLVGILAGVLVSASPIVTALLSLVVVFLAIMVFGMRKGEESILTVVLGFVAGSAIIGLLGAFGLPISVTDPNSYTLFSLPFVVFIGLFFAADMFYSKLFKKFA